MASLHDVREGDTVLVKRRRPAKVERVTETQIVIGAYRYWKRNGYRVGGASGYASDWIVVATPEEIAEVVAVNQLEVDRMAATTMLQKTASHMAGNGRQRLSAEQVAEVVAFCDKINRAMKA